MTNLFDLIGRILISSLFLFSGYNKMALLKNFGLAGGFIFIAVNGTKDWAIEKKKKYVRL